VAGLESDLAGRRAAQKPCFSLSKAFIKSGGDDDICMFL
jgi:hypothetical protein